MWIAIHGHRHLPLNEQSVAPSASPVPRVCDPCDRLNNPVRIQLNLTEIIIKIKEEFKKYFIVPFKQFLQI